MTEESSIQEPIVNKNSRSKLKSLVVMVIVILTGLGFFTAVDYPQALAEPLMKDLSITTNEIANLYTVYSFVNLVSSPLGGVLTNIIGVGNMGLVIGLIQTTSAVVAYFSIQANSYLGLLTSRVIFAFSGGMFFIVQPTSLGKFFTGGFLSLALGITNTFNMTFGALSNYAIPEIFIKFKALGPPFLFIAFGAAVAFGAQIIFSFLNCAEDGRKKAEQEEEALSTEGPAVAKKKHSFKFSDLTRMGSLFWAMAIGYAFMFNTATQINTVMTEMGMKRFGYTYEESKNLLPIIQTAMLISLPFTSALAQAFSRKVYGLLFAITLAICNFALMASLPTEKSSTFYLCLVLHGVFAAINMGYFWPSFILAIPKEVTSVGFAIGSLCFNSLFMGVSYSVGRITVEKSAEEYQLVIYIFLGLAIIAFLVLLVILMLDKANGSILTHPERSEQVKEARERIHQRFIGEEDGDFYQTSDDGYDQYKSFALDDSVIEA